MSAALTSALLAVPASGAKSSSPAHIYWTEPEAARGPSGNGINNIWRANLEGKAVDRNFVTNLVIPGPVAVGAGHIYWGDSEGATIGRARLDGTHVKRNLIVANADALAVTSRHIYWTESAPGTTSIWRANLDGSHKSKLFSAGKGTYAGGLAVNRSHIYWTNRDKGTIGRANLNGTAIKLKFITGITDPTGLALNSDHLYWASGPPSTPNTIGRADIGGGQVTHDFITGAHGPFGVAVGAGHIYWANTGDGTIGRARLDGTHVRQGFIHARVLYQGSDGADPLDIALGP